MTQTPYIQQLERAASIARAEIDRNRQEDREEAVWYGVREVFPLGLPEDVLAQAAARVELAIKNNEECQP